MTERPSATPRSAAERNYGSDFAKIDAHAITLREYEEIPELTDEMLAQAVPGNGEDIVRRSRGRPRLDAPKRKVTMRLDGDILDRLRASGPGWQRRVNDILRDAVKP